MTNSKAWLLDIGRQSGRAALRVAVSERELIHMIQQPVLHVLPGTPDHCNAVVVWQNRVLPVFDLARWIGAGESAPGAAPLAVVLAYQRSPGDVPDFGALLLYETPRLIEVDDAQACPPSGPAALRALTSACFDHAGDSVAVLRWHRLFTTPPAIASADPVPAPETAESLDLGEQIDVSHL